MDRILFINLEGRRPTRADLDYNKIKKSLPVWGFFHVHYLVNPDFAELPALVAEFNPSIVHVVGHGVAPKSGGWEDAEILWPEGESQIKKSMAVLQEHLLMSGELKCVIFSVCYSAAFLDSSKCRLPAAIGFRCEIEAEVAAKFIEVFYTSLRNGVNLANAFLYAKQGLQDAPLYPVLWSKEPASTQIRFLFAFTTTTAIEVMKTKLRSHARAFVWAATASVLLGLAAYQFEIVHAERAGVLCADDVCSDGTLRITNEGNMSGTPVDHVHDGERCAMHQGQGEQATVIVECRDGSVYQLRDAELSKRRWYLFQRRSRGDL